MATIDPMRGVASTKVVTPAMQAMQATQSQGRRTVRTAIPQAPLRLREGF